jgi:hypothetical protein
VTATRSTAASSGITGQPGADAVFLIPRSAAPAGEASDRRPAGLPQYPREGDRAGRAGGSRAGLPPGTRQASALCSSRVVKADVAPSQQLPASQQVSADALAAVES